MKKVLGIFLNSLPVVAMVLLILLVQNDYLLTLIYILIIGLSLYVVYKKNDFTVLVFGFVIMIISEYFFLKTGVETFNRTTLFGIMPLWLPFLWAYGFVAMKRSTEILNK